ncbi:MAG: polyprenyl synthetase family protein [Bacilli bacterium]
MNDYLKIIDNCLSDYVQTIQNPELKQAINYALFPGGKRIRPLLLLLTLRDLGLDPIVGCYAGAAIEMIHTYSLIHDDLPAMDDDGVRRGKPTVHIQFSEAIAVLAGDALLTDAFFWLTKTNVDHGTLINLLKLTSLKTGANGMVQGQMLDINPTNQLNEETIKFMNLRKTGDLFELALQIAGLIRKANITLLGNFSIIAHNFGLAFQIKDDLDDFEQKQAIEINTFVNLLGKDQAYSLFQSFRSDTLELIKNNLGENNLYDFVKRIL